MGPFPLNWPTDPTASGHDGLQPLPPPAVPISGDAACYTNADVYAAAPALPELPAALPPAAAGEEQRRQQEEAAGIRLVHLLVRCAGATQACDHALASMHLADAQAALAHVSAAAGIGRVAARFVTALSHRLYPSPTPRPTDQSLVFHSFYEACPYLKFAHFTANQAILEAFQGCDRVHVIDLSLMQGLQWPALIQALALRPGGPPFLRITGIGSPAPPGRDELREVGLRLAELARSVGVRLAFRGVAANRLDEVRPWMLQIDSGETIAVNSVLQLHHLLADPGDFTATPAPIDTVLGWIVTIQPKIFTVVEQEADHNKPAFLDRFTEALFYYSAVFDSFNGPNAGGCPASALAELYLEREIHDILCGEGGGRVERHELLAQWRHRLLRAGLSPVRLGPSALRQARMLLGMLACQGNHVEDADGCLTLGWHGRPLFSSSAWRGGHVAREGSNGSSSNKRSSESNNSGSSNGISGGRVGNLGTMSMFW